MRAVWVSAEHQCAVWCNQVAAALGSAVVQTTGHFLELSDHMRAAAAAGAVQASEAVAWQEEVCHVVSDLRQAWSGLPGAEGAVGGNPTGDAAARGSWENVEVSELVGTPQCFKVPQAASQCVAMCCTHHCIHISIAFMHWPLLQS